jgi:hypothetical protein
LSDDGHAIIGLGLNSASAEAMARAGATFTETAPQMIHRRLYAADVIVGSLSLLMPGSMFGEVTPVLVRKPCWNRQARKVLLPLNKRKVEVVGAEGRTLDALIDHAVAALCVFCSGDRLIETAVLLSRTSQSDHEGLKRPLGAMRGPF